MIIPAAASIFLVVRLGMSKMILHDKMVTEPIPDWDFFARGAGVPGSDGGFLHSFRL